jgi:hypothetical protein
VPAFSPCARRRGPSPDFSVLHTSFVLEETTEDTKAGLRRAAQSTQRKTFLRELRAEEPPSDLRVLRGDFCCWRNHGEHQGGLEACGTEHTEKDISP